MKASIPIKLIFWASRIKGKQRGTSSRSSLRVYTMSFLATDDVAFAADEFTTPPTADSASARPPARARAKKAWIWPNGWEHNEPFGRVRPSTPPGFLRGVHRGVLELLLVWMEEWQAGTSFKRERDVSQPKD